MFDSVLTWFTPERRARLLFPAEIALGVFFVLALLLDQTWRGTLFAAVVSFAIAAMLGLGVALHRVRPGFAVAAFVASGFLGLVATVLTGPPINGFVYIAAAIVLYGTSAYGSSAVRWIGLALSAFAALGLLIVIIVGSGSYFGMSVSYAASQLLSFLIWPIIALVPWLLGELVRSIRNRRALSTQVATVSTQRDAALTRADLEAERTRVARDVHDIVAHSLTVVIAQADGARYATASDSPAAADAFETIAQTARDALADVRVLLTELRHSQEAGPQPGLDELDELFAAMRDSGLALELREFGERGRLGESRELALYRIVQESLTNALRHGDGAAVIELEWGEQAVDLVVTNAAAGASAPATAVPTTAGPGANAADSSGESAEPWNGARHGLGHGIDGMRERASLAGGELSVHVGSLFRVRARLPLEPRAAAATTPELATARSASDDAVDEPTGVPA